MKKQLLILSLVTLGAISLSACDTTTLQSGSTKLKDLFTPTSNVSQTPSVPTNEAKLNQLMDDLQETQARKNELFNTLNNQNSTVQEKQQAQTSIYEKDAEIAKLRSQIQQLRK